MKGAASGELVSGIAKGSNRDESRAEIFCAEQSAAVRLFLVPGQMSLCIHVGKMHVVGESRMR